MRALELWRAVAARLGAGQRVHLTLVVDNSPHSPGTRGARMAVWEDGERAGTIGGGAMELKQLDAARQAHAQPTPQPPLLRELVHRSSGPGERSGMICAGQQTNLSLMIEPARHLDAIREIVRVMSQDEPGRLTITSDGALEVEAGGQLEPWCSLERAGAQGWRYQEQLLNARRAAIFGAGHCGLALARQLSWLGYAVSVADSRDGLDTLDELRAGGFADHIILDPDLSQTAQRVRHAAHTAAIIMTVSYPQDVEALTGALGQPFPFIGLMGAPAKLARIRAALTERGFGPDDLARISAPVGLPIHSETPAEIAVSVAAQLLSLR